MRCINLTIINCHTSKSAAIVRAINRHTSKSAAIVRAVPTIGLFQDVCNEDLMGQFAQAQNVMSDHQLMPRKSKIRHETCWNWSLKVSHQRSHKDITSIIVRNLLEVTRITNLCCISYQHCPSSHPQHINMKLVKHLSNVWHWCGRH